MHNGGQLALGKGVNHGVRGREHFEGVDEGLDVSLIVWVLKGQSTNISQGVDVGGSSAWGEVADGADNFSQCTAVVGKGRSRYGAGTESVGEARLYKRMNGI